MSSKYDFDAPQFMDLREVECENIDNFFNVISNDPSIHEVSSSNDRRVTFLCEDKENIGGFDAGEKYSLGRHMKTPVSKNHQRNVNSKLDEDAEEDKLWKKIENLNLGSSKKSPVKSLRASHVFEGIQLLPSSEKKHKMLTRADSITRAATLQLRSRSIPKTIESEEETDDSMVSAVSSCSFPKPKLMPSKFNDNFLKRTSDHFPASDVQSHIQPTKFVALAEQVANFHKDTPERYRTKPNQTYRPPLTKAVSMGIPKGPSLSSLQRCRPVQFLDRKQREQQEYEEMLKHQVKANPVNKKILKEVSLGLKVSVVKRPATCPAPFKLTEYKPKPTEEAPVFHFKAQPIPKKILQSPTGIPPKKIIPATTPKTPAITMPIRAKCTPVSQRAFSSQGSLDKLPRNTVVEPFSFDQRDRFMLAKKDETIKKILEEEKKKFNSFKANPIRKCVKTDTPVKFRIETKKTTTPMPFNLTKPKPSTEKAETKELVPQFKAKPAAILNQKPFFPIHGNNKTSQVEPFKFKTDVRVCERQKFDELIHKKEEEFKKIQQQVQLENESKVREEAKKLRKLTEFKANPVPKLKPFNVHGSNVSLTQPVSPCFRSGKVTKQ